MDEYIDSLLEEVAPATDAAAKDVASSSVKPAKIAPSASPVAPITVYEFGKTLSVTCTQSDEFISIDEEGAAKILRGQSPFGTLRIRTWLTAISGGKRYNLVVFGRDGNARAAKAPTEVSGTGMLKECRKFASGQSARNLSTRSFIVTVSLDMRKVVSIMPEDQFIVAMKSEYED